MVEQRQYVCVLKENGSVDIPEQVLEELRAYIPGFERFGLDVMFEALSHGRIIVVRDLPILSGSQSLLVSGRSGRLRE